MLNKILNTITSQSFLSISLIILGVVFFLSLGAIIWFKKKSQKSGDIFNFNIGTRERALIYTTGISLALVIVILVVSFSVKPKVIYPTDPSLEATIVSRDHPIEIKFDRHINSKAIKGEISPAIKGQWLKNGGFFKRENKLTFIPDESLSLETRYTISLTGIKNYFSKGSNYLFSIQTGAIPKVLSVSPPNGDEGALPNQEIVVEAEPFSSDQVKFEFQLGEDVPIDIRQEENKFILTPKEALRKGVSYNLKVFYTLISYNYISEETKLLGEKTECSTSSFKVVAAPGVKSYKPTGTGVLIDTPISIEFLQDMDSASVETAFSISLKVAGKFSWSGKRIVTFTQSENFQKNTKYTISLAKEAKTTSNENIEEALSYSFTTIGPVAVSTFSPGNGAKDVDTGTKIKVTFNQSVDHASAEEKFSLNDKKEGSFSWSGNIMTFAPTSLAFSQTYSMKISSGVKTILGLDSIQDYGASFQTKSQSTALNVPAYKQAHMYSCMITAARSALAYRGVSVSEATIISKVGYDATPWSGTWNEPGSTWGDPDTGIVGSLDGTANNIGWGYGAYWGPISGAIQSLGRGTEVKSSMTASSLAAEIAAGNPVIVWWVNGVWPSYELFWYKDGKRIRAVNGMHVQVVKGFAGTVENPSSFSVTDSGYGYPGKTFDTATFMAKWSWFGNTGVVVK